MAKKDSIRAKERHEQRHYLDKPGEPPLLSEFWVKDSKGQVVRYGLAFIDFSICPTDNGRVLGYDNGHGHHERHFMGEAKPVEFTTYEEQAKKFFEEVDAIRRKNA
jgi:hypothetical protein